MRSGQAGIRARLLAMGMASLATTAIAVPAASAAPQPAASLTTTSFMVEFADACLDDEEVAFLGLINDHRAAQGLRPLAVSASLSSAAAYHSVDMAANAYLDHTLIDGTSVPQNMQNFGYDGSTHGENIAAGMSTAAEALQIWQGSAEHNANMLGGQFGAIGIGRAYDAASPHGWYWTTIFGDVSDGPGWLCGEAPPPSKSLSLFQSVDGATSTSDVSLRTGPAETYDLVATLPANTEMTVTGREMQAYVPVKVDGMYGWVSADWIARGAISFEQEAAPVTAQPGTATALDTIELLSGPAVESGMVATIPAASVVELTGEARDGFLGVVVDGQQGWADAAYLEVANISSDTTLLQPAAVEPVATDAAAAPAPPQLQAAPGNEALTTANVNLRSQPSADAMVIRVLPAGSAVTLTGSQANGYLNVRVDGQAGWIDSAYLQ